VTQTPFWTVCVWCDQDAHDPRYAAEQVDADLVAAGLPSAILWSSDYASLNPGYWVTYSGTFDSERAAADHLERVRATGFTGRVRLVSSQPTTQQTTGDQPYWAVILGSFPSRSEAEAHAAQLRGRGLAPRLLFSSDYASLSPGFWITYIGPLPDRAAAIREAERLTGLGFAGANAREVRR
jgi:cell division septation protein DedD